MTKTKYTEADAAWDAPLNTDEADLDVTIPHDDTDTEEKDAPTWSPGDLCRGGACPDHGDCVCGAPFDCDEWRSGVCDGCYQSRDEMGGE
ncbi:hypothetical protein [Glycomyces paridis]|uniref:Uncharacterized protein n=1 Tax=Glycomyces paridis TaxID=2126555 RepID=A0A4V4HP10_9ACTN|nr:hypothetical protein [Glycomyces paridis]THV27916.1 hypothetical protein E9998_13065 [Glycomyces paridis]